MCGGGKIPIVSDVVGAVFGKPEVPQSSAPAPAVVRESPKKDDATITATAAQTAATEKVASNRRRRFSSLLATGGGGDASQVSTSSPSGKPTLGA